MSENLVSNALTIKSSFLEISAIGPLAIGAVVLLFVLLLVSQAWLRRGG